MYSSAGLPSFVHGNPLAEAIVPFPQGDQLLKALSRPTVGDFSVVPDSAIEAMATIQTLASLQVPRPEALAVAQRVGGAVYNTLAWRNPFHAATFANNVSGPEVHKHPPRPGGVSPMMSVFGTSGLGKTTMIRSILQLLPPVIRHREYRGRSFQHDQVPYLTFDAPQGGSITGLFTAIAEGLDSALGRTGEQSYVHSLRRRSIESMKVSLARAIRSHSVSVVHIDDIQRIGERGPASETEAAAAIIGFVNIVGCMLIVSGTEKSKRIFENNLEACRRASSLGAIELKPAPSADDPFFRQLLRSLFIRQLLPQPCALTSELAAELHFLTAGNTAFLISLFTATQSSCLATGQQMSMGMFRRVCSEQFEMLFTQLQPARMALGLPPRAKP